MSGEKATSHTMTILTALLIVAVAAFAILFFLLWRAPSPVGRFETAAPAAVDCPSGTGAPVCYGTDVTNVGETTQQVRCQVTPGPDTAALFDSGDDVYSSPVPLDPGSSITLLIQVSPSDGATVVSQPSVTCEAA